MSGVYQEFLRFLITDGGIFRKPVHAVRGGVDLDELLEIVDGEVLLHQKCHVAGNQPAARPCGTDPAEFPGLRIEDHLGKAGLPGRDGPERARAAGPGMASDPIPSLSLMQYASSWVRLMDRGIF